MDGAPDGGFVRFCEDARLDARCHGLDLGSLLIMPVQRVPRYKLLLDECLKRTDGAHPDAAPLRRAADAVGAVAAANNTAMARDEHFARLLAVQTRFEQGTKLNVLDWPARQLVREGELLKVRRKGKGARRGGGGPVGGRRAPRKSTS